MRRGVLVLVAAALMLPLPAWAGFVERGAPAPVLGEVGLIALGVGLVGLGLGFLRKH